MGKIVRDIKFKGKRVDNQRWIEGCFVKDPKGQCRIYWQPFNEASSNTFHFVVPETISEYTGVKDYDKIDIYENDVCKYAYWIQNSIDPNSQGLSHYGIGVIVYSKGAFMIKPNNGNPIPLHYSDLHLKVVGSIFDNTERIT